MDKSISYSLILRKTWSELQNIVLNNSVQPPLTDFIQSVQECYKREREVIKELDRYKAMKPIEVNGYVTILVKDINDNTNWLVNDKIETFANEIKASPFNRIDWYKIITPELVKGLDKLKFNDIVSAFYHHTNEFKNWLQKHIARESKSKPSASTDSSYYIREEFGLRLSKIETAISSKISNWKQGIDITECASFCELLFSKGYFNSKKDRIKTCKSFAATRYGVELGSTINSGKEKSRLRKPHRDRLNSLFATI
jgi:hypothetical protein